MSEVPFAIYKPTPSKPVASGGTSWEDVVQAQRELIGAQKDRIHTLETQLHEARELARIGGWTSGGGVKLGRGVAAILPGREG